SAAKVLPIRTLGLSLTDVDPPTRHGSYLWRAVVTPLATDRKTTKPEHAYELRAVVPVPDELTLTGTYLPRRHAVLLHGRLSANGSPRPVSDAHGTRLHRVRGRDHHRLRRTDDRARRLHQHELSAAQSDPITIPVTRA